MVGRIASSGVSGEAEKRESSARPLIKQADALNNFHETPYSPQQFIHVDALLQASFKFGRSCVCELSFIEGLGRIKVVPQW
jgi:hypothetical protein